MFQDAGPPGELETVTGSQAVGAEIALVRSSLVEVFTDTYRGRSRPCINGWHEIVGCRVELRRDMPLPLRRVHHLFETTSVPRIRLVGGVPTAGGFYALHDFLPKVRIPGAEWVRATVGSEVLSVEARDDVGDWALPNALVAYTDTPITIQAQYRLTTGQMRKGQTELHLIARQLAYDFKGLPKGTFESEESSTYRDTVVRESLPTLPSAMPKGGQPPFLPAMKPTSGSQPPTRFRNVMDALVALGVRRSGLRYREVLDLLEVVIEPDRRTLQKRRLHHDLAHALVEVGAFDLVRRQGWPATLLVPRVPRFVVHLRESQFIASLLGLTPSVLLKKCMNLARSAGATVVQALTANVRVPTLLRILTDDSDLLENLTKNLHLGPIEWVNLPALLPFDGVSALRNDPLPEQYLFDRQYDFREERFKYGRSRGSPSEAVVERRQHPSHHPAFAVVRGGAVIGWTRRRDLAILAARIANHGSIPYRFEGEGVLKRVAIGGPTLPLAFGRICTVFGSGPPGPTAGWAWGYAYPFGSALQTWVESLLPLEPRLKLGASLAGSNR